MSNLHNYHIMISHSWDYTTHYNSVKSWLDNSKYFKWTNYSVPLNKPLDAKTKKELKEKLRKRISMCSCVVILSGMYVDYSEWIDYEIDVAKELGRPIIGIKPWGQQRVPQKVQDNADVMIEWNSDSVVKAIREYAL